MCKLSMTTRVQQFVQNSELNEVDQLLRVDRRPGSKSVLRPLLMTPVSCPRPVTASSSLPIVLIMIVVVVIAIGVLVTTLNEPGDFLEHLHELSETESIRRVRNFLKLLVASATIDPLRYCFENSMSL